MRITPLDIRNHRFPRRLTGYDREEVDDFLRMVAEDFEAVLRESQNRREHTIKLQTQVEELSANEQVLQDTLTMAQKLSEDLKQTAVKEAEVLVGNAEIQGEKILDAAHRRAARLGEDIREMKRLRTRLAATVRATLESHLKVLDGLASEPPDDPILEGKVAYLTRNPKETKSAGES